MSKDLTIVIPLYNKKDYILKCLQSIYECTHNINYECIIIDDSSDDGSSDICIDFCNNHIENFTYIKCLRNHKRIPSYARNLGIRLANSKYITFFDADDWINEGYYDRAINFLNNNTDKIFYCENLYEIYNIAEGGYFYYNEMYINKIHNFNELYDALGQGLYIKGIFLTNRIKNNNIYFHEDAPEDGIFVIDYFVLNGYNIHINKDNFGFCYNITTNEQLKLNECENNELNIRNYIDKKYKYLLDE